MRQQHLKRLFAIAACLCSVAVVLVSAVPLPAGNQELDVLQIPLSDGKELDVLTLGAKEQEQIIAERNKRTIGLLRELFPDITKQIDDIVNRIIGQVIRVAGPSLLPALLGNNRPTTERSDFDADFEDDDDTSNDVSSREGNSDTATQSRSDSASTSVGNNRNGGTRVSIALPTFPPESGSTSPTATAASDNVSLEQATTGVAASTSTTTAAATTATPTPVTTSTTVATTSTQTTIELTTTTSWPVETPITAPSTVTTTASATSPITIPPPTPTILSPTTLPTTTVDSILVIPRVKSQSRNNVIPTKVNSSTVNSNTESTENTIDTVSTPTPPAFHETVPTRQYPIDSPSISDILNTATRSNSIPSETLPTPTIPATYIGRFEGDKASPFTSQQSSSSNALPLAVDVDRSQLVALVDNINRLLNSPNLLITNSNNLNTPQFTTTTIPITTTPLKAVSTQSSALNSTGKITKLLPVAN